MFKCANAFAGIAAAMIPPFLVGCCGSGVRSPESCPVPPVPACEVKGDLVYNLGGEVRTNSKAVRLDWSVNAGACENECPDIPPYACQTASPGGTAVPDNGGIGKGYEFPDDATAIPGIIPAVVLIPSAGTAPAREVKSWRDVDGAFQAPAEPKSETPETSGSDASGKAEPEIAAVPEKLEKQPDSDSADKKSAAAIDKYESVKGTAKTSPESRTGAVNQALPPVPEVSDINAAVDAILSSDGTDQAGVEISPLPEVELPPSLE
ncbi:MAG: hypothetical protein LBE84_06190 [Planctomycetota bacterium]|nr:hypothetical protein [Planctomycetota bacterium]